jgi:hypothetical protein
MITDRDAEDLPLTGKVLVVDYVPTLVLGVIE